MKIVVKPRNKEPFTVSGNGVLKNGIYYIDGKSFPEEIAAVCSENKFVGIGAEEGKTIYEEDSFDYALERISHGTEEEKLEFVEWFFSGNWVKEREEEL